MSMQCLDRQLHLKLREQSVDVDLGAIPPANLSRCFGLLTLGCGEYCLFPSLSGVVFPECKVVICVLFLGSSLDFVIVAGLPRAWCDLLATPIPTTRVRFMTMGTEVN